MLSAQRIEQGPGGRSSETFGRDCDRNGPRGRRRGRIFRRRATFIVVPPFADEIIPVEKQPQSNPRWILLLYRFSLGMNPRTPLVTTDLLLYSVVISSFISF